MSTIGYYFVRSLLHQAGWPRKQGLLRREVFDTFLVDQVVDQMVEWGASLAAGRPKLALQMVAEMFREKDWESEDAPNIKMFIDECREKWDTAPSAGPSEITETIRLAKTFGKSMNEKDLQGPAVVRALEQYCLYAILWGLGNPDRVKTWYMNRAKDMESSLPGMQRARLQVEGLPTLSDWFKQCKSILKDYESNFEPLPEIPKKLLEDAEAIGVGLD